MRPGNRGVRKMRTVLFGIAGALLSAAAISGCAGKNANAESAAATPPPSAPAAAPTIPYDREKMIESFEVVWKTPGPVRPEPWSDVTYPGRACDWSGSGQGTYDPDPKTAGGRKYLSGKEPAKAEEKK